MAAERASTMQTRMPTRYSPTVKPDDSSGRVMLEKNTATLTNISSFGPRASAVASADLHFDASGSLEIVA